MRSQHFASIDIKEQFSGPAIPVNHFTEKRTKGRLTQYIISGGPKYYKEGGKLLPINTSICKSSDKNWDWEVKKGLYKFRVRNSGEFEFEHIGKIFSQKLKGLGFLNVKTKEVVKFKDLSIYEPVVDGNTITWKSELGITYKLIYENDRFRDVLYVTPEVRNLFLKNLPNWNESEINFGIVYDVDLSNSGIIGDYNFDTSDHTLFGKDDKVNHFVFKTYVYHQNLYNAKNSIEEELYADLKWQKHKYHNNGVYIESVPIVALFSPEGDIVFNTAYWFQQGINSYTGCMQAYFHTADKHAEYTDRMYIRAGYPNVLGFDVSSITATDEVIFAGIIIQAYESYETADIDFGKLTDPDSRGPWLDYGSSQAPVYNPTGYATYDYLAYDTVRWSGASGDITSVMDTAIGSYGVTAGQAGFGQFEIRLDSNTYPGILTMVQGWVDGTIPNNGMWFQDDGITNIRARGKYYGTASERPALYIIVWNANFTDDFETNDFSKWDDTGEDSGTISIDSATEIAGSYSFKSSLTGGSANVSLATITKEINFTELFVKFDFRLNTGFPSIVDYVNLLAGSDIAGDTVFTLFLDTSRNLGVWNPSTFTNYMHNVPLSINTVYNIEFYFKIHATAGIISVKLGGSEVIRFDGDTRLNFDKLLSTSLGLVGAPNQAASSADFDTVTIADQLISSSGTDRRDLQTRVTVRKKATGSLVTRVSPLNKTTKSLTTRVTVYGRSIKTIITRVTVRRKSFKFL